MAIADQWSPAFRRDEQRVVLPPIVPDQPRPDSPGIVGNHSGPSGSGSSAFAFTNTFESSRSVLSSSRMDSGDPATAASSVSGTPPATFRRPRPPAPIDSMSTYYQDQPINMGWLAPSQSRIPPSRPSTSQSSSYPEFDTSFIPDLQPSYQAGPTSNHHTAPQSPAFSFGPSPFPNPNANYLHPRSAPPLAALAQAMPNGTRTTSSRQDLEEEVKQLRIRVRELEIVNDWATDQLRVVGFDTNSKSFPQTSSSGGGGGGGGPSNGGMMYSGGLGGGGGSSAFQASWKSRTDARIKKFCSLNRAGNALCAWHDSRRERRSYPPRMAPAGHLNCGCTYEQALFEESLARHGVGSYHPGEMVRMDPALRNPLLALLERRFGYKDGDFERDPMTGQWVEGEGAEIWEAALVGGNGGHANKSGRKGRSVDEGR